MNRCKYCKKELTVNSERFCDIRCRIFNNTVVVSDCLIWMSGRYKGFPVITINRINHRPVRIIYEKYHRKLELMEKLFHKCDDVLCLNPDHITTIRNRFVHDLNPKMTNELRGFIHNNILSYAELGRIFDVPMHHVRRLARDMGLKRNAEN